MLCVSITRYSEKERNNKKCITVLDTKIAQGYAKAERRQR